MNSDAKKPYLQKVLKSISIQHTGFRHFAERYLQNLSIIDLERLKPVRIKELLDDGWTFLQTREQEIPKVSIRNLSMLQPSPERGTIIQLLIKNIPFVADSIITEMRRKGYDVSFVLKGAFYITRKNAILENLHTDNSLTPNELLLHIELMQQLDLEALESLEADLLSIVNDIELAVADFIPMKGILEETQAQLLVNSKQEETSFIEWVIKENFIFLGVAEINRGVIKNTKGILKQSETYAHILKELSDTSNKRSDCLWFHKPSFTTKIDRYEPLDVLRINTSGGKEVVLIGILTYAAKTIPFIQIPYISHKINMVIEHLNESGGYYNPKEISIIVNQLPFIEIMNLTVEELSEVCKGILTHQSKYVVLVRHRFDPNLQQISVMMFIHQEKLTDTSKDAIKALLTNTIGADILHYEADYIDNDLICLYAIVTSSKDLPEDIASLPEKITAVTLSWTDRLKAELIDTCGVVEGEILSRKYLKIFNSDYKAKYTPEIAALDAVKIDTLFRNNEDISLEIYGVKKTQDGQTFHLKFLKPHASIALYELFTVLDSLGLRLISETSFTIEASALETKYWIHDLIVETNEVFNIEEVSETFKQLCYKVLADEVTNDDLNSLVLKVGLNYRQVTLIKAFLSYLKQIQFPFGGKYNRDILLRNPILTKILIEIYEAKFSPTLSDESRLNIIENLNTKFEEQLSSLTTEDEDKLFRHLYNLITYILRTNYFILDNNGQHKPYISFKIASQNILEMPLPAPMAEIFVYSKKFEAIHLRSGKVARGGIRWSDRGEDYRVEVLGLVKAQITKNAVIVPMGSKGGFYIKHPSPAQEDVIECYKNMMRAMLDITDNMVDGQVIRPNNVISYDEYDPYLVVAADKGTASFSDIANEISAEYNFWLKDAFASGGSAGYDHKKMAITSKGAWESVKQHFKEALNLNPEKDPFTAVGIGDMSGDVFGNGLLRSKTIQLKAAFNHRHIFIDPNPDAEISFKERERLFNLPRSSWTDYSLEALSEGGMVIERTSKTVKLSSQAKAFLEINEDIVRPNEIIKAILKSNVDLIWLGGIGTYIKSSQETNEIVSDRANDLIRVNGQDVRAKVIAEGANLGCTQKGRIEYALSNGGRINTDFIDNSGGVDCSDHEVNIKILLNKVIEQGDLSLDERNNLLKTMTDDVGAAVTSENVLQNLALTYANHFSATRLDEYSALMRYLSLNAGLNPKIEFLPSSTDLHERQKLNQGLTRPELSVLMAYTKNHLKSEILKLDILSTPSFNTYLKEYFPAALNVFSDEMQDHPLKREIIATKLTSEIVDRLGIHFVHRLLHQTGKTIEDILKVYAVIRKFFNLASVWYHFDNMLINLTYEDRIDFMHSLSETVYNGCAWLLMFSSSNIEFNAHINRLELIFSSVIAANLLLSSSTECAIPSDKSINLKANIYELQQRLTAVHLSIFEDTVDTEKLQLIELLFNRVQTAFNFDHLNQVLKKLANNNFWHQLFILSTQIELEYLHVYLTKGISVSILANKTTYEDIINTNAEAIEWLSNIIQESMVNAIYDPAAVTVIMRHLGSLTKTIIHNIN